MGVSLGLWEHAGEDYDRDYKGFAELRAAIAKAAAEVGPETAEQVRPLIELDTYAEGILGDEQCQGLIQGLTEVVGRLSAEHAEDCAELMVLLSRVAGSEDLSCIIAR